MYEIYLEFLMQKKPFYLQVINILNNNLLFVDISNQFLLELFIVVLLAVGENQVLQLV